jgi:inner membrane protein
MPSPIGHALAGVAVAWTFDRRADWRLTTVAAALAALPDADLLTPIRHRTVTHSIGAVIIVTIIAGVVTGQVTRRTVWRVSLVCGAAYASHLLLDWLGADTFAPYGLQALWPFSDRFYISGWNVFRQTARGHMLTTAMIVKNLQAIAQEVAILGPVVAALWLIRVKTLAGLPAEMPRRHHPAE